MSFVTLKFLGFFALLTLLYWVLPQKLRKIWLLLGSYAFYVLGNGAFALLLLGDTVLTFLCALAAERELLGRRRLWTALGAVILLGSLFLFKYASFFWGSVFHLGVLPLPKWALPLGISFFTFSVCGYLFDVGNGRLQAEKSLLNYGVFTAFFPTLPAGPINRAAELLPQLHDDVRYDGARTRRGFLRFVLGMAKKLVAADNIGLYVDAVYGDLSAADGSAILLAVLLYSFQIYLDFSACTDMACGCAWMLGYSVPENFRAPYLSRSVRSFWKKWHISLTDWFRRYLYFPLGGSRRGNVRTWVNILIVFAVSGLWHGAGYTFLLWGLLNGCYQIMELWLAPLWAWLRKRLHLREGHWLAALPAGIVTFLLVSLAWVLFRASGVGQAVYIWRSLLRTLRDGFDCSAAMGVVSLRQMKLIALCLAGLLWEDVRTVRGAPYRLDSRPFLYWGWVLVLALGISFFGVYGIGFDPQEFVYFQF